MEERRKNKKEKNELLNLKRNRNEQPTIRQTFSALKNDLKKLSQSDWENIPEIKDFTIKKRKIERYIPITDSEIMAALNDTIIPLKEEKEKETNLENVGKAKNSILKMLIDKIGEEKGEKNSVDRLSYLTELNTLNKDNVVNPLNSFEGVQDMKKAKLLLNNLITTNPENPLSWISAARLEMMDNELLKAREILAKAIEKIKNSDELWIEYSRLYDNDPVKAKYILNKGIIYLPKSEKLYLELIKLEKNDNEKKKILKKCLFEKIPTSEILWKILIELEKNNPEIYKRLLIKCTEYFPKSINNWIILDGQGDYHFAKGEYYVATKPAHSIDELMKVKIDKDEIISVKDDVLYINGEALNVVKGAMVERDMFDDLFKEDYFGFDDFSLMMNDFEVMSDEICTREYLSGGLANVSEILSECFETEGD